MAPKEDTTLRKFGQIKPSSNAAQRCHWARPYFKPLREHVGATHMECGVMSHTEESVKTVAAERGSFRLKENTSIDWERVMAHAAASHARHRVASVRIAETLEEPLARVASAGT